VEDPRTPTFFATPEAFRAWLEEHHADATELLVGYYKKGSGRPSMTWPESVDQALCFGWIDGVRRRIDDERYSIRFTPRKAQSTWSAVNLRRVPELVALDLMRPAGIAAFERRLAERSSIYAYEQRSTAVLGEDFERQFRANEEAWTFFAAQPAGYRQTAIWWVISAKRDETKRKRLAELIDDSAHERRLARLTRY
jgi:uncharacterized protein YdeI (YjbR/CyaY-like superfamily)